MLPTNQRQTGCKNILFFKVRFICAWRSLKNGFSLTVSEKPGWQTVARFNFTIMILLGILLIKLMVFIWLMTGTFRNETALIARFLLIVNPYYWPYHFTMKLRGKKGNKWI